MANIDDFNKGAALVLEKLYEAFPRLIDINAEELDLDADANAIENYNATIEFLEQEGFIRITQSTGHPSIFLGVTLTAKGLAILNSTPDVLKEKTPLGERLGAAVKSGSKDLIKTVMEKIIESATTGLMKGLGQ